MKKWLCLLLTCTALSVPALAQNTTSFGIAKPYIPPKKEVVIAEKIDPTLLKLMYVQTAQKKIAQIIMDNRVTKYSEKDLQLQQDKMNALTTCNINNLKPIYQNPANAWGNITKAYDEQEKDLTLSVNSADTTTKAGQDQEMAENRAFWSLGRDVLTDVYANPEKYGDVKQGADFPLWQDQQYIYAEQLKDFAMQVGAFFGTGGLSIPGILTSQSYAQNNKAYQTFLQGLMTANPQKMAALPAGLANLPVPPDALPPENEFVFYVGNPAETNSVFPAWPAPWKTFIDSKFETYNPAGEMAHNFKPKTLELKDSIKHAPDPQTNRLDQYQMTKKQLDGAKNVYDKTIEMELRQLAELSAMLKNVGINQEFEKYDVVALNKVHEQLIGMKKALVEKGRAILKTQKPIAITAIDPKLKAFEAMSYSDKIKAISSFDKQSDEYEQAMSILNASKTHENATYLKALETDENGTTLLFPQNANDVEHLMKQTAANNALQNAMYDRQDAELAERSAKKIDKDCLNGGV